MEIPGYEITRCIGQGGMATAYLAKQTSLDRLVVLKILDTSTTDIPLVVERFLNEGRLVAALNHPHVITIFDINTAANNVYIAMEYVEGGDLKERLRHQSFAPAEAINITKKIASGLEAAHAKGIVHRDVKPGNILFRKNGSPLLSDFGIAKDIVNDGDLTATGMFVGSPNYMSPEQAEAGAVDGRADIYSLGVIFFEMLTGQKPYVSDSIVDVIMMHKKSPIPRLPGGLEIYQELIDLMLAKDREARFRDAGSLLHYLEQLEVKVANRAARGLGVDSAPDFDVTGTDNIPSINKATRLALPEKKRFDRKSILLVLLVVVGIANLVLAYIGQTMDRPAVVEPTLATSESLDEIKQRAQAQQASDGDMQALGSKVPNADEVVAAMRWLGQHSLNEYRLTAPPKDNAYYYFSRLLDINTDDPEAINGIKKIAERYAVLADRAIADADNAKARGYIAVGLQIDPSNEALKTLNKLVLPERNSFLSKLTNWF